MALKHWIKQIVCMNVRLQACSSGGHCDAVPWLICLYDSGLGFYAAEHKIQIWASATGSCRTGHRGVHALTHINAERRACTNRLRTREESSPSYATVWSRVVPTIRVKHQTSGPTEASVRSHSVNPVSSPITSPLLSSAKHNVYHLCACVLAYFQSIFKGASIY